MVATLQYLLFQGICIEYSYLQWPICFLLWGFGRLVIAGTNLSSPVEDEDLLTEYVLKRKCKCWMIVRGCLWFCGRVSPCQWYAMYFKQYQTTTFYAKSSIQTTSRSLARPAGFAQKQINSKISCSLWCRLSYSCQLTQRCEAGWVPLSNPGKKQELQLAGYLVSPWAMTCSFHRVQGKMWIWFSSTFTCLAHLPGLTEQGDDLCSQLHKWHVMSLQSPEPLGKPVTSRGTWHAAFDYGCYVGTLGHQRLWKMAGD